MAAFLGPPRDEQRGRQACRSRLQRRASNPRHRAMTTASSDEVIRRLTSIPKSLRQATGASGLPSEPGLYAWWTVPGSIPDVTHCPHPTLPDLDLFYVGISPSGARSSQNLRRRVAGNHIKGNTGGSTFRLTLA